MNEEDIKKYIPFVIRKFSKKEQFNPELIYKSLLRETNISEENARKVTNDTIRFLICIDPRLKFVTSPMLREIVNIILLQNGLEDERLRYTRIGFPVYDLKILLEKENREYYSDYGIDEEIANHVRKEYKAVLVLMKEIKMNNIIVESEKIIEDVSKDE